MCFASCEDRGAIGRVDENSLRKIGEDDWKMESDNIQALPHMLSLL